MQSEKSYFGKKEKKEEELHALIDSWSFLINSTVLIQYALIFSVIKHIVYLLKIRSFCFSIFQWSVQCAKIEQIDILVVKNLYQFQGKVRWITYTCISKN